MGFVSTLAARQPSLEIDPVRGKFRVQDGEALVDKTPADIVTVTRNSTAMRWNAQGQMEQVAANVLRLDYDPLTLTVRGWLIEGQRTNLAVNSENFFASTWNKSRLNLTPIFDPAGVWSTKVAPLPGGDAYLHPNGAFVGVSDNTLVTLWYDVKPAELTYFTIQGKTKNTQYPLARFNLTNRSFTTNGLASAAALCFEVDNGYIRCVLTWNTGAGADSVLSFSGPTTQNEFLQPLGADGVKGAYIRRGQVEIGGFPTSYILAPATFVSRASAAWCLDSTGALQQAATNGARDNAYGWDSDGKLRPIGLLLEGAATNKVVNSSNPTSGSWTPVSIQPRQASGDTWNGMTGTKVIGTGANWHRLTALTVVGVSASEAVTLFYKPGTSGRVRIVHRDNSANSGSGAESIIAGPVGGPYTISTSAGDLKLIRDIPCDTSGIRMMQTLFTPTAPANSFSFAAGPDSVVWGEDVIIYGMQVESGAYPTSYIPTGASQVTRAADVSSSSQVTRAADNISSAALSLWFNPTEGCLFAEFSAIWGTAGWPRVFGFYGDTEGQTDAIQLGIDAANNKAIAKVIAGNVSQASSSAGIVKSATAKSALAYRKDDFGFAYAGAPPTTDTAGNIPAITKARLGSLSNGADYLNGHIRLIRYYPRRLSNDELQQLTA
ncbi:hypothetical protein D3C81_456970 [compost metagenome]